MTIAYDDTHDENTSVETDGWLAQLTIADGLFVLVLVLAGVLRLLNLDAIPLAPSEASNAYSAWQLWQPEAIIQTSASSSAYVSLTALLMPVLGADDVIARLIPALAGMGLVLVPWLMRRWLGSIGALAAGLLLAVSPTLGVVSRTADGTMLALLAGGLLLVAWLRYQEAGERQWLIAAAIALALGLTSSALFYGLLLTLGLAYLAQAKVGPPLFYTEEMEEDQVVYAPAPTHWPERVLWRNAAAICAATLLGLSTLFFWYLPGLGITASLPATWLGQISFQGPLLQWVEPILALGRYELILLVFGVVAIAWSTWQGRPFPTFFIYWFTGILLLIFVQRGNLDNVLLLTLPGYLLIGLFVNEVWSKPAPQLRWLLAAAIFLLGLMAYINLHYASRTLAVGQELGPNLTRAIFLVVIAASLIIYLARFDAMMTVQGVIAGLLPLLLLFTWGTAWWLSHHAANDPRERWVRQGTDDDVMLFTQMSRQLALQIANSEFDLDVFSAVDSPVLHWYMRDFAGYETGAALPDDPDADLLITAADGGAAAPSTYLGTEFGLLRQELSEEAAAEYQGDFFATLRWWFFHESQMPVPEQKINVWLRTELAR